MHPGARAHASDVRPEHVDAAVDTFRLLADTTRVRILLTLAAGESSVGEIAAMLDRPAAGVSQHLAKLRWARLVSVRQEGNRAYYSLVDEHALQVVREALLQAEHAVDTQPAHHGADGAR